MKKWFDSLWTARILLLISSAASISIWMIVCWDTICKIFTWKPFSFPFSFFGTLFLLGLLPLLLTVLSFLVGHRHPSAFRGKTVLLGLIYAVFFTALCFSAFQALVFLSPKRYPVQSSANAMLYLISMAGLGITLLIDSCKIRPSKKECRARFLVCCSCFASFFLAYMVIWEWLCVFADRLK